MQPHGFGHIRSEPLLEPACPGSLVVRVSSGLAGRIRRALRRFLVVAAIVGLARAFGMTTVAEGIETDLQWQLAAELGCEFGQGYRFGQAEVDPTWLAEIGTRSSANGDPVTTSGTA